MFFLVKIIKWILVICKLYDSKAKKKKKYEKNQDIGSDVLCGTEHIVLILSYR